MRRGGVAFRLELQWRRRRWRLAFIAALWLAAMGIVRLLSPPLAQALLPQEREAAAAYHVPSALVEAVVQVESGGNPHAVSDRGALGLMQVMPDKFRPGQDPFAPRTNLDAGTRYLAAMVHAFHGDLTLALAAYNAGPAAVRAHHGVPDYPETKAYVREVLSLYHRIERKGG